MRPHNVKPMSGFTLIELLVVLLIISVITSVALLTIRHNENKQLEVFSQQIISRLQYAQERALLMPVDIGVVLKDKTFSFVEAVAENEADSAHTPKWLLSDDAALKSFSIENNISCAFKSKHAISILISRDGEISPFTLSCGLNGKQFGYTISDTPSGTFLLRATH
jgi:general secretion pathway protein H